MPDIVSFSSLKVPGRISLFIEVQLCGEQSLEKNRCLFSKTPPSHNKQNPCTNKLVTGVLQRRKEEVIRRSGSDLLSRVLRQSTMGAKGFNVRVRNGIGWDTFAITTRSSNYFRQHEELNLLKIIYA